MYQIVVRQADCLDCPVCHPTAGYCSGPALLGSSNYYLGTGTHFAMNAVFESSEYGL